MKTWQHKESENLWEDEQFSVEAVVEDDYSHYLGIFYGSQYDRIAFDPMDRTVAGVISEALLDRLGGETTMALSDLLLNQLGAKQFLVLPAEASLPGYTTPEQSGFSRLRYSSFSRLQEKTDEVLDEYRKLAVELDKQFHFLNSEEELLAGHDPIKRYEELHAILEETRFTPDKMAEYEADELQGTMSRFKNNRICPLVMVDKKGKIAGLVRVLKMNSGFGYLSDEVINQDLISLDRFSGSSEDEKRQAREEFLLSYLLNGALWHAPKGLEHFFIIAADGREKLYENAGFEGNPGSVEGFNVVMKLSKPGPLLEKAQARIKALPLPQPAPAIEEVLEGPAAAKATKSSISSWAKIAAVVGIGLFAYSRYFKNDGTAPDNHLLPQRKL